VKLHWQPDAFYCGFDKGDFVGLKELEIDLLFRDDHHFNVQATLSVDGF
jgi:hypothetical protein